MQIGDRERLAEAIVAGGVDGHDRLAARRRLPGDRARERELLRLQRALVDVARHLDRQLAPLVLEQQEAALGVGQLDDGVDDRLEQARQPQLAVEPLVDAQEAPQPRLGGLARAQPGLAPGPAAPSPRSHSASGSLSRRCTMMFRRRHADLLENGAREIDDAARVGRGACPSREAAGQRGQPPGRRPAPAVARLTRQPLELGGAGGEGVAAAVAAAPLGQRHQRARPGELRRHRLTRAAQLLRLRQRLPGFRDPARSPPGPRPAPGARSSAPPAGRSRGIRPALRR